MRSRALIDAINEVVDKGIECEKCIFDCKSGSDCLLIATAKELKVLQDGIVRAQKLLRIAVDDLRDADRIECDHCKHWNVRCDVEGDDEGLFMCETCHKNCACKECRDNSRWEWRGWETGEGTDV